MSSVLTVRGGFGHLIAALAATETSWIMSTNVGWETS